MEALCLCGQVTRCARGGSQSLCFQPRASLLGTEVVSSSELDMVIRLEVEEVELSQATFDLDSCQASAVFCCSHPPHESGVDRDKKESVVNIIGSQKGALSAAYACLALGAVGIIQAAQQVGDMRVVGLLAAFILCGCVYQVSPISAEL